MPGPSASGVKDVLVAYSRGLATIEAVMRSLIRHRTWLAPAVWMAGWRDHLGTVIRFGDATQLPPGEVWLFTDLAAVSLASASIAECPGAELGLYAAEVPGLDIFRKLDGKWDINVNPGSPCGGALVFQAGRLRPGGDVVRRRRAGRRHRPDPPTDARAFLERAFPYRWFLVPQRKSDNGLVTLADAGRGQVAPRSASIASIGSWASSRPRSGSRSTRSASTGPRFRGRPRIRPHPEGRHQSRGPVFPWTFYVR